MTGELSGYELISDSADLRIAVRELSRIQQWMRQFADMSAETPDVSPERVAGVRVAASLVARLQVLATARLMTVTSRGRVAVSVVDPDRSPAGAMPVGVSEVPVVSRPAVDTDGISSAMITLQPGHASVPRSYPDDMIVMGLAGRVSIVWWDDHGAKYEQDSARHQHTHVPGGIRHCIYNAGLLTAQAVQFRAAGDIAADVVRAVDETPVIAVPVMSAESR